MWELDPTAAPRSLLRRLRLQCHQRTIFWLHFFTLGGSEDALVIFIYVNRADQYKIKLYCNMTVLDTVLWELL